MKTTVCLGLIFFVNLCFSQNLEKIKNSDTVYVIHKDGKQATKILDKSHINTKFGAFINYSYTINSYELYFRRSRYLNYDDYASDILADVKIVNKRFLKSVKDISISYRFLYQQTKNKSPHEIYEWVEKNIRNKKKSFYLIDKQFQNGDKFEIIQISSFLDNHIDPTCKVEHVEVHIIKKDSIKNN